MMQENPKNDASAMVVTYINVHYCSSSYDPGNNIDAERNNDGIINKRKQAM